MRKGLNVFLLIAALMGILSATFCVWQRENIHAVYMYITANDVSDIAPMSTVTPQIPEISDESDENALAYSAEKNEEDARQSGNKRSSRATVATDTREPEKQEKTYLQKCREELYACEEGLVSRVGGMREEVLAEWRALPAEQRTSRKKREMIISGIGRCLSLEGEVDEKVKAIIAKYKAQAGAAGENTAEIAALWDEYKAKKAKTKAYYLNKYLG